MGTILASAFINTAATTLLDTNNEKWSRAELLNYLNDGQRQIVILIPQSASLARVTIPLVAGTEQSIPSDGWMLIDVYRNMGVDGVTPGNAIRLSDKKLKDAFNPNWHAATQVTAPSEWMFDPQAPATFWVDPPSDGSGHVEINYSQVPPALTSEAQPIGINDIFETALNDYILYRAHSKKAEYADPQRATAHYSAFTASIGFKAKSEVINDPNQDLARPPPDEAGVQR